MSLKTFRYNLNNVIRRKIWLFALVLLPFLFTLPIATAMKLQNQAHYMAVNGDQYSFENISSLINNALGMQNIAVTFIMTLAAFLTALVMFSYMHNKTQVDLFHSLPAKRGELFFASYLAGLLIIACAYLIMALTTVCIIAAMGYISYLSWPILLSGCGVNLLFFLALYSLGALAASLTGHIGTQGLLTAMMYGIAPLLICLYRWVRIALQPFWFEELTDWSYIISYSSPLTRYFTINPSLISNNDLLSFTTVDLLIFIAFVIIITFTAWLAYKKRPSEAAGHALAFPWTRIVIKYPLVFCFLCIFSMTLHEIGDYDSSWTWYCIGAVLGGFIIAQIVEIIYRFDFRGISKKLLPTGIFIAVFIAVSLCVIYDVTGYNSYVPQSSNVATAEVKLNGVANDIYDDTLCVSNKNYYSSYGNDYADAPKELQTSENSLLNRGYCSDPTAIAAVCFMAEKFIAHSTEPDVKETNKTVFNNDNCHNKVSMQVRYHLNNGRVVTRDYSSVRLDICQLTDQLSVLYRDHDYIDSQYALFGFKPEQIRLSNVYIMNSIGSEYCNGDNYYGYVQESPLINNDCTELLRTFEQEIKQCDAEVRQKSLPVAQLNFCVFTADPGIINYKEENTLTYRSFSYAVYPECVRTIELLKEMGFTQWEPNFDSISYIDVNTYGMPYADNAIAVEPTIYTQAEKYDMAWENHSYYERAEIERLVNESFSDNAFYLNGFIEYDQYHEIIVYYTGLSYEKYGGYDCIYRYNRL